MGVFTKACVTVVGIALLMLVVLVGGALLDYYPYGSITQGGRALLYTLIAFVTLGVISYTFDLMSPHERNH